MLTLLLHFGEKVKFFDFSPADDNYKILFTTKIDNSINSQFLSAYQETTHHILIT